MKDDFIKLVLHLHKADVCDYIEMLSPSIFYR